MALASVRRRVTVTGTVRRELRGPCSPVRDLPDRAADLLEELMASPRLAARLRLVHDFACQLAGCAGARHPALRYDRDATLFGAATHDMGKAAFPAEITASLARASGRDAWQELAGLDAGRCGLSCGPDCDHCMTVACGCS